jgi:hypothetical protein
MPAISHNLHPAPAFIGSAIQRALLSQAIPASIGQAMACCFMGQIGLHVLQVWLSGHMPS